VSTNSRTAEPSEPASYNEVLLDVRGLKVVFHTEDGVVQAVDGVSFQARKGHTLGIVGESGCGKSVSALSVLRLVPSPPGQIVAGEILWKNRDLMQQPMRQMPSIRGREIAMIFQNPMTSLNPVFTIGKQLGEVLRLRFDIVGALVLERAAEALRQVGIPDPESRLTSFPHELSGGMKQRVMIAMALMAEPDLLIADEPTTALDVTIQAQILHLMRELQKKKDMAIVLITHDMGVIAETCDDVVVMYAGRIVERGSVYEVFEHPKHPYTYGLLQSIPKKGATKEKPLMTIEGTVPSLIDPPKHCRFSGRCFNRQQRCIEEDPPLEEKRSAHEAACFFPVEDNEKNP
jgi:oligopeptide/dipeptide ABC transporter ATP-binding protein